ncbi:MAG: mechanosensitive ion channel family protein [Candidatus Rokuibacteriota bacterium]
MMPQLSMESLTPYVVATTVSVAAAALRIALVCAGAWLAVRLLRGALRRLETLLIQAGAPAELVPGATRKRVTTLTGLLSTLLLVTMWALAGIIVLGQLGLDITPVLAGAGIVGLAVGFGAQNLVRDVISGFFVVLENQVRVGDVAVVNGTGGLVEAITFRTMVLRDLAGVVHVIPHGVVTTLANMTKDWSAYVVDVGVAYREDTDRAVELMREVAEALRRDPRYAAAILEPIEIFGVDDFAESQVTIKARLKTRPLEQWNVGREYRRRLKQAFDSARIEFPLARRSLYVGEASRPLEVVVRAGGARGTG